MIKLDNLERYDKKECLEILGTVELPELWDQFLQVQAEMFFNQEVDKIANEFWWQSAGNILEQGSGNGAHLFLLFNRFKQKKYTGIERDQHRLEIAKKRFGRQGIAFIEGDAEIKDEQYVGRFDVVLFRLILQHLHKPRLALENAHAYLNDNGHVFITDSYDPARRSSHEFPTLKEASAKLNEINRVESRGNRQITMEILRELEREEGQLAGLYTVVSSNLSEDGDVFWAPRLESKLDRIRAFNAGLLHAMLLQKYVGICIDLSKVYEELSVYLDDEHSWLQPGAHYLLLKKI